MFFLGPRFFWCSQCYNTSKGLCLFSLTGRPLSLDRRLCGSLLSGSWRRSCCYLLLISDAHNEFPQTPFSSSVLTTLLIASSIAASISSFSSVSDSSSIKIFFFSLAFKSHNWRFLVLFFFFFPPFHFLFPSLLHYLQVLFFYCCFSSDSSSIFTSSLSSTVLLEQSPKLFEN